MVMCMCMFSDDELKDSVMKNIIRLEDQYEDNPWDNDLYLELVSVLMAYIVFYEINDDEIDEIKDFFKKVEMKKKE